MRCKGKGKMNTIKRRGSGKGKETEKVGKRKEKWKFLRLKKFEVILHK